MDQLEPRKECHLVTGQYRYWPICRYQPNHPDHMHQSPHSQAAPTLLSSSNVLIMNMALRLDPYVVKLAPSPFKGEGSTA